MAETETIVRQKTLNYKGLFDTKGLYRIIHKLFKQHSFDWNEFKNAEHVYKDHKMLEMDIRPYKRLSDYVKCEIRIDIIATDLKETEVEVKGIKKRLMKGNIVVHFKAFLITDYEGAWDTTPFYYLIRTLFDKFVYKGYIGRSKGEVVGIINEAYEEIRSFLNMHRHYLEQHPNDPGNIQQLKPEEL